MSVTWPGSMRGSQVKSSLLLLLFLLLLNAGTVLCQDEEDGEDADAPMADEDISAGGPADGDTTTSDPLPDNPEPTQAMDPPPTDEEFKVGDTEVGVEAGSGGMDELSEDATDPSITSTESLSPTIILIPVGLVVLIIAMIVGGIFISRRCNTKARKGGLKEEDPYLDGSATEKVPMPMFEEDVPSVLELEMEELDQWMQQDGEATKESMQT